MPSISSSQHKALVHQFIQLTQATEKAAMRYLKESGYKLDESLDAYFANEATASLDVQLHHMFDALKRDPKQDGKDSLGVTSTMEYFGTDLGVNIENAELFVAFELVQAPSVGTITRKEYVEGWKSTRVPASAQDHKACVRSRILTLRRDPELFKRVYRHTFVVGKDANQKSMDLETALIYWDLLFSEPGRTWKTERLDWFALWKQYLNEQWTRSINRDMWNQTLEFAQRSMEDETLSFWREDGAWPGVIDAFVKWCRTTRVMPNPAGDVVMA